MGRRWSLLNPATCWSRFSRKNRAVLHTTWYHFVVPSRSSGIRLSEIYFFLYEAESLWRVFIVSTVNAICNQVALGFFFCISRYNAALVLPGAGGSAKLRTADGVRMCRPPALCSSPVTALVAGCFCHVVTLDSQSDEMKPKCSAGSACHQHLMWRFSSTSSTQTLS